MLLKDHSGHPVEKGLKQDKSRSGEASWELLWTSTWEMKVL